MEEEIYIRLPEGILGGPRLARLIKALYGLKQSPRCWNITVNGFIIEGLGFTHSPFDPCVYFREDGTFILIYVDDLLIIGCYVAVQTIKHRLAERFDVVALGGVKHFLGLVVTRDRERCTITLEQSGYVDRLLGRFGMVGCHGVSTPLDPKVKILPFDSVREQEFDSREYRSAIGGLHWLADATRPDIAFATGLLGRFSETPGERHWQCVKRVLRYLAKTRSLGLTLGGEMSTEELVDSFVGYVDADFAGDALECKSTTGFVFKIGVGIMAWHSKKQSITAISMADAEFIASAAAIGALIWFRELLAGILRMEDAEDLPPTILYNDNAAALSTFADGSFRPHSRHIGVEYYRAREVVMDRTEVDMRYCGTADMLADGLTKGLSIGKHSGFIRMCGLE